MGISAAMKQSYPIQLYMLTVGYRYCEFSIIPFVLLLCAQTDCIELSCYMFGRCVWLGWQAKSTSIAICVKHAFPKLHHSQQPTPKIFQRRRQVSSKQARNKQAKPCVKQQARISIREHDTPITLTLPVKKKKETSSACQQ